jgi:hypothetical protein
VRDEMHELRVRRIEEHLPERVLKRLRKRSHKQPWPPPRVTPSGLLPRKYGRHRAPPQPLGHRHCRQLFSYETTYGTLRCNTPCGNASKKCKSEAESAMRSFSLPCGQSGAPGAHGGGRVPGPECRSGVVECWG